jgi:hypothetical protein
VEVTRLTPLSARPRRRSTDRPTAAAPALPGTVSGDRQLLRAAALGDAGAWDRLVDAYAGEVWQVPCAAGLPMTVAAGVSEQVWSRLAESLPYDGGGPLGQWLRETAAVETERAQALLARRTPGWDGVDRRSRRRESG